MTIKKCIKNISNTITASQFMKYLMQRKFWNGSKFTTERILFQFFFFCVCACKAYRFFFCNCFFFLVFISLFFLAKCYKFNWNRRGVKLKKILKNSKFYWVNYNYHQKNNEERETALKRNSACISIPFKSFFFWHDLE